MQATWGNNVDDGGVCGFSDDDITSTGRIGPNVCVGDGAKRKKPNLNCLGGRREGRVEAEISADRALGYSCKTFGTSLGG